MQLTGLDIVFLVLLLIVTVRAGLRGFTKELLSMAAVIVGISVAVMLGGTVAPYLAAYVGTGVVAEIVAFLVLFLVAYVAVKLVERFLRKLIERIHLENLDHALGLFLGLVEGTLVIFVLIVVLQFPPFAALHDALADSVIAGVLAPLLPHAARLFEGVPGV